MAHFLIYEQLYLSLKNLYHQILNLKCIFDDKYLYSYFLAIVVYVELLCSKIIYINIFYSYSHNMIPFMCVYSFLSENDIPFKVITKKWLQNTIRGDGDFSRSGKVLTVTIQENIVYM